MLIATRIGSWRIMSGVVLGAVALSTVFWAVGSDANPMFAMPPWWHLVVGGFAFGAVFMATDPVSAAMTSDGQMAVRHLDRRDDDSDPRDQSGVSGGDHVGDLVWQRDGAADRLLRHPGQCAAKERPVCSVKARSKRS